MPAPTLSVLSASALPAARSASPLSTTAVAASATCPSAAPGVAPAAIGSSPSPARTSATAGCATGTTARRIAGLQCAPAPATRLARGTAETGKGDGDRHSTFVNFGDANRIQR